MAKAKGQVPSHLAAHVFHKHTLMPNGSLGPAVPQMPPQTPGAPSDPMTQVRYISSGKFGPPPSPLQPGPVSSVPPSLSRLLAKPSGGRKKK